MAQFNFTYDEGTSLQQMIGFEMAGLMWGNHLQDNTTINLHVGVTASRNLPHKVIGGAIPAIQANQSYSSFRNNYQNDRRSSDDYTAANNLQQGSSKNAAFAVEALSDRSNWTGGASTSTLNLTRANAKALNLTSSHSSQLDGVILMSDLSGYNNVSWSYDYTRSAGANNKKLDFLSTALHEIGHVLGFVSGIDQPGAVDKHVRSTDWYASDVSQQLGALRARAQYTTPLDLFRFDDQTAWSGRHSLTYGNQGGDVFFSIDGGRSEIAEFATGENKGKNGDGYQASHWKRQNGQPLGILDPDLRKGERANISALDLRLLDVIGWDVNSNGSNYNSNLYQIQQQAEQHLASSLGWSTAQLNQYSAYAEQYLSQNRGQDVANLLDDSDIYDLNWQHNQGGISYWLNWLNSLGGDGWWQMVENLFQQRGLFSQLSDEDLQAEVDVLTGQQTSAVTPPTFTDATSPALTGGATTGGATLFSPVNPIATFTDSLAPGTTTYSELDVLTLGGGSESTVLAGGLTGLNQDLLQAQTGVSSVVGIRAL